MPGCACHTSVDVPQDVRPAPARLARVCRSAGLSQAQRAAESLRAAVSASISTLSPGSQHGGGGSSSNGSASTAQVVMTGYGVPTFTCSAAVVMHHSLQTPQDEKAPRR